MSYNISFDVDSADIVEESDPTGQFAIARVHAFSSGQNRHDMTCSVEVLERTASTLFEKPLVFDIDSKFGDFAGHTRKPFIAGFVLKDSAEFIELEDGRVGLTVLVKIWKHYSGQFMSIFKREKTDKKKVSVEMELLEVEKPVGGKLASMIDFVYSAICVLGTLVTEASPGAHIQMLSFSDVNNKEGFITANFSKYEDVDFKIPEKVSQSARKGLDLYAESGLGVTAQSISMARFLVRNESITPTRARSLHKFLSKNMEFSKFKSGTKEHITWLLWGGSSALPWSGELCNLMGESDEKINSYFQEPSEMVYKNLKDANPAIRGIKPPVTLGQANEIARQAEAIGVDDEKNGWAIAISNFKKNHRVENGRWVKKNKEKDKMAKEKFEEQSPESGQAHMEEQPKEEEMELEPKADGEEKPKEEEMELEPKADEEEEPKEEEMAAEDSEEEKEDEEDEEDEEYAFSHDRMDDVMSILEGTEFGKTITDAQESKSLDLNALFCTVLDFATALKSEHSELVQFRSGVEKEKFDFEVASTLKEVERVLSADVLNELREKSEAFSLAEIDSWKNMVRATAFQVGIESNDGFDDKVARYDEPSLIKKTKRVQKSLWSAKKI